jgi:predicted phosphodiesterase
MRVLLIADVHANWEALLALQRAEPQPDAVLFAGDAVGYGPDPANCVRWLRTQATEAVRGDFDNALITDPLITDHLLHDSSQLEEAAHETLTLARTQLAPADRAALTLWPLVASLHLSGAMFVLAHATPARPLDGALDLLTASDAALAEALGGRRADFVVLGHTHLPALRRTEGGTLFINPGSLGQPRYGVPDATYAVWEDGDVRIRHLHYDHDATARRLGVAPLSPEVVEQLTGILESGIAE